MYTLFFKRDQQDDMFNAKETINWGVLPEQTSQIHIYTSFFKCER